ncbi:MAG: Smr/MutS family protein [Bacteriovoracia bacterium]
MSNSLFLLRSLESLEWGFIREELTSFAKCEPGVARCEKISPLLTQEQAILTHRKTAEALKIFKSEPLVHSFVNGTRDVSSFFEKAQKETILDPIEISQCGRFLGTLSLLAKAFESEQNKLLAPTLSKIFFDAPKHDSLEKKIQVSVSSDGTILDTASPLLARLRADHIRRKTELTSSLEHKVQQWFDSGFLQDNFFDVQDGRFVVPVRAQAQSKLPGILVGKSATGQSLYVEPLELTTANNALKEQELEIQKEETRILKELSTEIAATKVDASHWIDEIADLDFLFSSAMLVNKWELSCPTFSSHLEIKEAFHPKLHPNCVKNSFNLPSSGASFLLSGPNTGGKSVLLKTVGLVSMMAKSGLFVPAYLAKVPFYSEVIALIGDDQNLEEGLSSYSAQIFQLKTLLEDKSSKPRLILIDEILSNTDPDEASALGFAILERLLKQNTHSIVSTHYQTLTRLSQDKPGFYFGSMEFFDNKPTYKLLPGHPGHSHALEIASNLGLDSSILVRAKEMVSKEKLELAERLESVKKKEFEYNKKLDAFEKEKEKTLKEFSETQKSLLEDFKSKFDTFVDTLSKHTAAKTLKPGALIKKAKDLAKDLPEQITKTVFKDDHQDFQIGDEVWVKRLREKGKVLSVLVDDKKMTVQVGHFKQDFDFSDVEPYASPKVQKRNIQYETASSVPSKLDLRGKRLEEAKTQLEAFLDQSFRSGVFSVKVITGHGTGAIKKMAKELISQLPYVKGHKPEHSNDDGALIVELEL